MSEYGPTTDSLVFCFRCNKPTQTRLPTDAFRAMWRCQECESIPMSLQEIDALVERVTAEPFVERVRVPVRTTYNSASEG